MEEQTPVSNPLNQLSNDPIKSSSLIKLMSILLLISCVIAGFFAYQTQKLTKELLESRNQNLEKQTPTPEPTDDPTSDWKTYTNEKYGFSFKYPINIVLDNVYDDKSGSPIKFTLTGFEFDNLNDETIGTFAIYDSGKQSLNDFVNSKRNIIYPRDILKNKNLTLGNINMEEFIYKSGVYYIFSIDGKIFSFNVHDDLELFQKILSTFKFLDEGAEQITQTELSRGWYWGDENQKKIGTPNDWLFLDSGRSSCWHKPNVNCY